MIEGWTLLNIKKYNQKTLNIMLNKIISETRISNNQDSITVKIIFTTGIQEKKNINIPYCMADIEKYASIYTKEILNRDYELLKMFFDYIKCDKNKK